jgi:hypothetical protein
MTSLRRTASCFSSGSRRESYFWAGNLLGTSSRSEYPVPEPPGRKPPCFDRPSCQILVHPMHTEEVFQENFSRLTHQPVDHVSVIDAVLEITAQSWQLLHALLRVPHLQMISVHANVNAFANQPTVHRVDVLLNAESRFPGSHSRGLA